MRVVHLSCVALFSLSAAVAHATDNCVALVNEPVAGHGAFDAVPPGAAPDLERLRIGRIDMERLQIFNLDDPAEDIWLWRLANRLHILTQEQAIEEQLQFGEGERYRATALRETERILREQRWLFDARVVPTRRCNDTVDVKVVTRDVWSLTGTGELERAGGDTSVSAGIQEVNLLGRGENLGIIYTDGIDRSGAGFFFIDEYLAGGPGALVLRANKNSDGGDVLLDLSRPFRNLDERISYGMEVLFDLRDQPLFEAGGDRFGRFQQRQIRTRLFTAASTGRIDGEVQRWTLGLEFEDFRFDEASEPLQLTEIPGDRRRTWPFVRFESIEDDWDSSLRLDFLQRPGDVYMGRRFGVTVGYSPDLLGADAERIMLRADIRDGYRPRPDVLVFWQADVEGAFRNNSDSENLITNVGAEVHWRHHPTFGFFAAIEGTLARGLTDDRQLLLGGENGLRGYPSRFQQGDRRVAMRLEERWFSTAHPFQLLMVGAAAFVDVGRAWFPGDPDDDASGWMTNIGAGVRIGTTRGVSESLFHIDVAVPLRTGGPNVDDVLLGLSVRRSF